MDNPTNGTLNLRRLCGVKKRTTQQVVEQFIKIHGDTYLYDKVNFVSKTTPVGKDAFIQLLKKALEPQPNDVTDVAVQ